MNVPQEDDVEYVQYASRLKDQGNEAFKNGDIPLSIKFYSEAIDMDPDNHLYYSNRSAAYMKADSKSKALWDATKCVELAPDWSKGYNRLGTAQHSLGRFEAAIESYKKGIELDSNNQALWTALAKAQDSLALEKQRRYDEAARERAVEEEALRQKDLAKEKAKREDEVRKKKIEKEQLKEFLNSVTEDVPGSDTKVEEETQEPKDSQGNVEVENDVLAGFFSELCEEAKEKERLKELKNNEAREQKLTEKYTLQDLGTGKSQYERLTQKNYVWKNQNPYLVMQLGIDATEEDIKYRYRKLSAKIHPDKLRDVEEPRLAFEELKNAYHKLMDEKQKSVILMTIEHVEKEVKKERKRLIAKGVEEQSLSPLEDEIANATLKRFADMYLHRQKSEHNLHAHNAREKLAEEDEKKKAEKYEEFDKEWSEVERREKRVGGWRDFQEAPDSKKVKASSYKEETRKEEKHGVVKIETWKKNWK